MHKKHKVYLIFSVVFWLLIFMGLMLFGYSFGRVQINKYGILRNYYSSWIDEQTYISGLYHIGIGCYFIQFPSSKVYLNDIKLNVTNKDMNVMQITYSLVYRLQKDSVFSLYQELSTNYQSSIIASINSIISTFFIDKNQQQSRVTLQSGIVSAIKTYYGQKVPILKTSTVIEAFWLNQIDFFILENTYETAYLDTGALSEAYSSMQIQMMKNNMNVQTINNLIDILKNQLVLNSTLAIKNASFFIENSAQYKKVQQQLLISTTSQTAQIFQYYPSPRISLS